MKHKLVTIGNIGMKHAYLDVPREEAIERFKASCCNYFDTDQELEQSVYEFEFDDEFYVYDAGETR